MAEQSRWLRALSSRSATVDDMLVFRTLNHEANAPSCNEDDLALRFRDALWPWRSWWLRHAAKLYRRGLEHPKHGVPGCVNFVDARTSWLDGVARQAVEERGIKQVVVVAAGFDTRAYRLGRRAEGVRWFEVDLPAASRKKQQLVEAVLQPAASFPRPTFIAADLASTSLDAALLAPGAAAGFNPSLPTLFTIEGLIYYLSEAAVRALFSAILRVAAPGSALAFDFLHKQVLTGVVPPPPAYAVTAASVANKGEPFLSGIEDSREGVAAFLGSIGLAEPGPAGNADAIVPVAASPRASGTAMPALHPVAPLAMAAAPAGDAAAAAGAGDASAAGVAGAAAEAGGKRFELAEFLGPRDMVAARLPHLAHEWGRDACSPPPILSFYSYAAAVVVE